MSRLDNGIAFGIGLIIVLVIWIPILLVATAFAILYAIWSILKMLLHREPEKLSFRIRK
jgi:hypothetical protein